jgi:hypothetical protein
LKQGQYQGGDGSRGWFDERSWELLLPDKRQE